MEKHEVVIVGVGPAGLKAAELLGEAGKDAIVIERDPEKKIGDKPCAGGLPPHAMKYFPEDLYENVLNSISIYLGDKKMTFSSGRPVIAMASRLEIGQYQLKLAKEAGAQIMANTPVKGLDKEKSEVTLNDDERVGYKYLIAADGSTSIIRRALGYNTKQIVQYIEYPVPGNLEDFGIYFDLKKYGLTYV
jgi:geranylgeranyl reductase